MAEKYSPGLVRLWYRATGFKEGIKVTGDFRGPERIRDTALEFIEEGDGIYHLDYCFPMVGSYVGIFLEDGIKKVSQNFNIEEPPRGGRFVPRGSNLLNV
ncbi:MAG: hypothetical protein ACTSPI_17570 [Candidatus Heimdallarchaeaceae archaeon]